MRPNIRSIKWWKLDYKSDVLRTMIGLVIWGHCVDRENCVQLEPSLIIFFISTLTMKCPAGLCLTDHKSATLCQPITSDLLILLCIAFWKMLAKCATKADCGYSPNSFIWIDCKKKKKVITPSIVFNLECIEREGKLFRSNSKSLLNMHYCRIINKTKLKCDC